MADFETTSVKCREKCLLLIGAKKYRRKSTTLTQNIQFHATLSLPHFHSTCHESFQPIQALLNKMRPIRVQNGPKNCFVRSHYVYPVSLKQQTASSTIVMTQFYQISQFRIKRHNGAIKSFVCNFKF